MDEVKRGELYYADLSPVVGSEQGGIRPVLILQNDKTNQNSTTTIVAANSDLEEKQERLVSLRQRIDELTSMDSESAQNGDFDELFESLYTEMYAIKDELEDAEKTNAKLDTAVNQIDEMTTVMYGLKNHPVEYNEQIVRQLISSIKVVSAEQILILFKDGTEITADL